MKTQQTMNAPDLYEIRVAGHLSERWTVRFEGLSLWHESGGAMALSSRLDQVALHGSLKKVRDLGMPLISVNRVEPGQAGGSDVKQ